jgi:two-component system, OmpR family, response regulator
MRLPVYRAHADTRSAVAESALACPTTKWSTGASISSVRVLVVEDEIRLASLIRRGLREEGLLADVAIKGEDALWMAASSPYDVLTLDVLLPGIDGLEVLRRLREGEVRTPVLMLTARDDVQARIEGLDAGADDYLVKPFDFGELVARLRALARRGPVERGPVLSVAGIELDPAAHRVTREGQEVALSTKEFQLLEVFMRHPDQVLNRYQLLEGAWDSGYEHRSNVIDVYVRYLREKLDRPFGTDSLETVRGVGYRLRSR